MIRCLKTKWFVWSWFCVVVGVSFTALGRDPFFPLGYKIGAEPVKTNTPESMLIVAVHTNCATEAEWNEVAQPLQVTGSLLAGSRQTVYINKKPYATGQRITTITTTNSLALSSLTTTNRFTFEVTVSDKKPLLKRVEHVRSEPMYVTAAEARLLGILR